MCSHYENEQRFLGPPNDGNRCFLALLSTEEGTGSGSAASVRWRRGAGLQATGLLGCGAGAGGGDGCPSQLAAWRRENSGPCSRNQLGWPLFSLHVKCKEMTSMCQALHRAPCWGGSLTASSQHGAGAAAVLTLRRGAATQQARRLQKGGAGPHPAVRLLLPQHSWLAGRKPKLGE